MLEGELLALNQDRGEIARRRCRVRGAAFLLVDASERLRARHSRIGRVKSVQQASREQRESDESQIVSGEYLSNPTRQKGSYSCEPDSATMTLSAQRPVCIQLFAGPLHRRHLNAILGKSG